MKKSCLSVLCLALCVALCGCARRGGESASAPTPAPAAPSAAITAPAVPESAPPSAPAATSSPTAAPEISAGSYVYEDEADGYWQLNLKDNGTFSVISRERIYNGEGWSPNGDGTVTTGPTEAAGAAPFFDEFGSSVWVIDGTACRPVY